MPKNQLLEWFKQRKLSTTMDILEKMIESIHRTATEMNTALESYQKKDFDGAQAALKRLYQKEEEADSLQKELFDTLHEKEPLISTVLIEDLLNLFRIVDFAADWTKIAGKNLQIVIEIKATVPEAILSHLIVMGQKLLLIFSLTREVIRSLATNAEIIPEKVKQIKIIEREMDGMYFAGKKLIAGCDAKAGVILILNDLLTGIENATDVANQVANQIELALSSKKK